MYLRRRHFAMTAALPFAGSAWAQAEVVHIPPQGENSPPIYRYVTEVLPAALAAGGLKATLVQAAEDAPQSRWIRQMELGYEGFDITWFMTNNDRERRLAPVRVPLFMGLFGWRLLLVLPNQMERLARLRTLVQWREVPLVQGQDWPDTDVLRANQLQVVTASRYANLLALLRSGRAMAFPRAVVEAAAELALLPDLRIEPNWVINYPAAMYFFVNRKRPELHAALNRGMEAMADDGRLRQMLLAHFGDMLKQARLRERRVLRLDNPNLPPQTPLGRKGWWLEP
jgi:hypothetical protein